jgi:hypothetical protein
MDENTRKKMYAALAAPFPESCIQRTEGRLTGRGYDTTGIAYQFVVNRLNECLGLGGFRVHREVTVKEVQRSNGRPAFEALCDLTLELGEWVDGKFVAFAESIADGGHLASSEADARKGATTQAFKKAAAYHGVGKQAYEGTLDDDNVPDEGVATASHLTQATHRGPVTPPAPMATVAPQAQPPQTPPGYLRTGATVDTRPASATAERNRLSSKQLAAIWSIARKLGVEQSAFRTKVKSHYGCQLEFLNRQQASEVITSLNAQLNGNGSGSHANEHGASEAVS